MTENDVIELGTLTEHRIDRNNPHNVTKAQVGLGNVTNDAQVKRSEMGQPDGVALLNSDGKIPSSYLPSYVSDIITADSYAKLPATGEEDKIYVTKDTNLTYRWSGTSYVEISPSLALGETSTTAYAGNKGASLAVDVQNLEDRVGHGYIDTETSGFAYIGTGSSRVRIIPGADILLLLSDEALTLLFLLVLILHLQAMELVQARTLYQEKVLVRLSIMLQGQMDLLDKELYLEISMMIMV